MDFREGIPIYRQVVSNIKSQIVSGEYQPGQRIDSVRDLAMVYGINPNTMQKALSELESEQLLKSQGSIGRFVTDDLELIKNIKFESLQTTVKLFVDKMRASGVSISEMIEMISIYDKGDGDE